MTGIHQELKLVRGIQVAPGDTDSAEPGYFIIDLLAGAAEGFALKSDVDGWNPAIPAPKAGLWSEVPFTDGRTPIASAEANASETMRITVSAPTHLRMSQLLRDLYRLIEDCDRYWNDEFYNQPVFLHWWATGAPGRQYALIMSMDADVSIPTVEDDGTVIRDVVLTIEREPFWRWEVPPGSNPIYWTLYAQGKLPGLNYDYLADLRLIGDSTYPLLYALAQDTVENKVDYTTLTNLINTINSQNLLAVPAASIPGDAPALVQITLRHTSPSIASTNYSFMVSRMSKQRTATQRNSEPVRFVTMIPFTAGFYSAPPLVLTADAGGVGGYNVTTNTTIAISRLEFTPGISMSPAFTAQYALNKNTQRGRFAVFVRCRQHNGATGDITLRVRFLYNATTGSFNVVTRTVSAVVSSGTGQTGFWPLVYVDTIRLPADRDATLSTYGTIGGSGLYNELTDPVNVSLEAARSTGVGVLYIADIVLMPYDETMLDTVLVSPVPASSDFMDAMLIDSTGYLTRGKPTQAAIALKTGLSSGDFYQAAVECRGMPLTLQPNVDNSIYVLEKNDTNGSRADSVMAVSVNIVPRSRGIRDV